MKRIFLRAESEWRKDLPRSASGLEGQLFSWGWRHNLAMCFHVEDHRDLMSYLRRCDWAEMKWGQQGGDTHHLDYGRGLPGRYL